MRPTKQNMVIETASDREGIMRAGSKDGIGLLSAGLEKGVPPCDCISGMGLDEAIVKKTEIARRMLRKFENASDGAIKVFLNIDPAMLVRLNDNEIVGE